jgi:hypothetical protein
MIKYVAISIIAVLSFASCTKESEKCKQAQEEVLVLKEAANSRDSQLEDLTSTINAVDANLSAIKASQSSIDSLKKRGGAESHKEKIQTMITGINSYIAANNEHIKKLENRVKASKLQSKSLDRLIVKLKSQLAAKEQEIVELKGTVQNLNIMMNELDNTIVERNQEIANKDQQLTNTNNELKARQAEANVGYFYFGSKKNLLDHDIIKKEGGVLGMGKSKVLNEKLDKSIFRQISTVDNTEMELGQTKRKTMITSHPTDSYTFIKQDGLTVLKITNPEKFWSLSKYCVVETD